jgi:hypothetical protein
MRAIYSTIFTGGLLVSILIGLSGCMTFENSVAPLQFMSPAQTERARQDMETYDQMVETAHFAITTNEELDVKAKLEAYEQGKLTVEDLNEKGGDEENRELIGYYFSNPDDIPAKDKFPISRSFAKNNGYPEAAALAQAYISVYPNDGDAWGDLGYDYSVLYTLGDMDAFDKTVSCYDSAVTLGNTNKMVPLALSALMDNRMNIADRVVPQLLVMHKAGELVNEDKLLVASILVTYSIVANREDIFVETINSENLKDLLHDEDLKREIKYGCKIFKGEEVRKIHKMVKETKS